MNSVTTPTIPNASRFLGSTAATCVLLGGAISLAGWIFGVERLTDWWGTGITIKANAAIAAGIAGLAVLLTIERPHLLLLRRVLGGMTLAIGALTLFEHISGIDLYIDTLLFDEPSGALATAAPGRIGVPASVSFICIGAALLLKTMAPFRCNPAVWLCIAALGIGMLSLTGYWYGAKSMYSIAQLTGIAVQTAIMLIALSIGLIAANFDREPMKTLLEDSTAGLLARRVLPIAIGIPLILGWLRLQGLRAGLYDNAFGTALRTFVEIAILGSMLWWSVQAIRIRDLRQQRAEAERLSSEQRLSQTMELMTDGFITFDRHWRFNYINAEAEHIMGRKRAELQGKVLWDLFPQIVATPLFEKLCQAAKEHVTAEVDGTDFQSGQERHFRNRIYPHVDGGVAVYFQDVTIRKRAEDALREADRTKDELLAVLAHELRNPLAPIRNAAALLSMRARSDPTLRSSTEIIERQIQHMARLLEDLLDISRISRNRLELRRESIDLVQVIHTAVETSLPAIEAAGHDLTLDLPSTAIYLLGDPVRLAQMFSSLLNNAAKYTSSGGQIQISARVNDDRITVRVTDSGIGIAAETLPHIFKMFTQFAHEPSDAKSGLGLGLFLASNIVQLHGGYIEARSAGRNSGSEFMIELPLLKVPLET